MALISHHLFVTGTQGKTTGIRRQHSRETEWSRFFGEKIVEKIPQSLLLLFRKRARFQFND